jgi:uncharacterized protein
MIKLEEKLNKLINLLKQMESVVIGFSGGVDSTFLAAAAYNALADKAILRPVPKLFRKMR